MGFIDNLRALGLQRQIMLGVAVLGVLGAMTFLVRGTMQPSMSLLYAGLDPVRAGEVISELDQLDVTYEIRGEAIFIAQNVRDKTRFALARDGLPRQSIQGYELLDDVNGFSVTSEMYNAAYWRAKEGELARTMLAMPSIRSARVHLGTQKTTGFSGGPMAKSASVTLSASGGLSAQQAKAIQYLTALAVSGLNPTDVAVIDTTLGVIAGPGLDGEMSKGGMGELERAAQIKSNLLGLLEARVGVGNARVNVSLDIDRERITTAERSFDPDTRVLKSQTTNEITDSNSGSNGSVTVASNLPEGEAGNNRTSSDRSETSETVTYEISELVKNTEILPGGIKRLTVAVLVSDIMARDDAGNITRTARTDEELESLQDLVSAAAGLDQSRGDVLTLRSMSFDQPIIGDMVEKPGMLAQFLERYLWSMIQAGFLALIILVLGLFVVKPLLSPRSGDNSAEPGLLPMSLTGVDGTAVTGGGTAAIAGQVPGETLRIEDQTPGNENDPIEALRSIAADQSDEAADLLASWLENDAQRAS